MSTASSAQAALDRLRDLRRLLGPRGHREGCPFEDSLDEGRVEAYNLTRPANPHRGEPEKVLGVVRCIECAGQRVLPDTLERTLDRLKDAS